MRSATWAELESRAPFDASVVSVSKAKHVARVVLIKGNGEDSEQNAAIDLSFDADKDTLTVKQIAWEITQEFADPLLKPRGATRDWENMDNDGGRGVN